MVKIFWRKNKTDEFYYSYNRYFNPEHHVGYTNGYDHTIIAIYGFDYKKKKFVCLFDRKDFYDNEKNKKKSKKLIKKFINFLDDITG